MWLNLFTFPQGENNKLENDEQQIWEDSVKIAQLMITFVEHLANLFAQCVMVDMQKISMPFDSASSLWSRKEKISMWACQPSRFAKPL